MGEDKLKQINNTFNQVPFSHLLGSPLLACIDAQKQAANSSIDYIYSVGFYEDSTEVVNVTFNFYADGRPATLVVPLLTIVPVPFFSVDELDIKFNAMVDLHEEEIDEFKGNYSKPVSESNSNYTYDYFSNLNVHMAASKDHVPTGLSTLMGMLDASIRVVEASDTADVVSSLRLDPKELDMLVGDEVQLFPSSQGEFTWSRSNPEVVELDQTGKVKALKVGKSRIYVRTEKGERVATCLVRVIVQDFKPLPDPDPTPPPGNTPPPQPKPVPPPIYTSGSGSGSGSFGFGPGGAGETSGGVGLRVAGDGSKLPSILAGMVGGSILADHSTEKVIEAAVDKINQAQDKVSSTAKEIKDKASSIYEEVKQKATETSKGGKSSVDKEKEKISKAAEDAVKKVKEAAEKSSSSKKTTTTKVKKSATAKAATTAKAKAAATTKKPASKKK
ncbi:MAG: DUF2589 domain-containing protein [Bacteroidales bacterium]|nr:DUF2589 domain-containing protein [Bacteroidales bacterium]